MNVFSCPICNNNHVTSSNYSRVVCNNCILTFGTTDKYGKKLEIIIDESPFFTKVGDYYSKNRDCYVNKKECYIITSEFNETYELVCTIPIPKINENKIILRNVTKDSISFTELIDNSITTYKSKIKSNSFNSLI